MPDPADGAAPRPASRLRAPLRWNRWTYATLVVGVLFGLIQVVHTYEMLRFGSAGVLLEGIVPLLFAVGTAVSGPWLHSRGYDWTEQKLVVLWMAAISVVSGLLFLWALSHQFVVADEYLTTAASYGYGNGQPQYATGGLFPHARFVTATNLTAGALVGLLLGVYNVRSRRHYRAVEQERERVAHHRTRLAVLNRVLRHNLRNDATVILGHLRAITDQVDGRLAEHGETAIGKTTELVALGDKARRIDTTLGAGVERTDDVEITSLVRELTADRGRAEVTVDIPGGTSIRTNRNILTQVLEEAIENAVEHSETDSVRIRITSSQTSDGFTEIVVEDSGPGLPEHERTALVSGEETSLEHTSGLGLWLIKWGVAALGGDVTFAESDLGGTAVRIRLPPTPDASVASAIDDSSRDFSDERADMVGDTITSPSQN